MEFKKKSKKRILIIGDSLSLPRNYPEVVELFATWPKLLNNNEEFEIIQLSIGGATVKTLYDQTHYYKTCKPDIVIIQSGIVDCAPRALGWLEKEIINSNKFLSFIFERFMPIKLLRKYRKLTYTSKVNYKKIVKKIIEQFSSSKIIFISIIPASEQYDKLVPGISNNIKSYNKILKKEIEITQRLSYLETDNIPFEGIMTDHHHLNSIGHFWLSEKILSILRYES